MNFKTNKETVVIVGGGFAGVKTAKSLDKELFNVILIDRTNHHLFQPLLYQVATGVLSPGQIAPALRTMMKDHDNVQVMLADVYDFNVDEQEVFVKIGDREETVAYDYLVVAAGATHSYFGNDQWAPFAPGMKTLDDARRLRSRILTAFEMAEQANNIEERRKHLSFVVVGGGPTGVELAGQISELAHKVLKGEYRHIDPVDTKVTIIDASPSVLGAFDQKLREKARHSLEDLKVEVITSARVNHIDQDGVKALTAEGEELHIDAKTVIWAAGVAASPLAKKLALACKTEISDRAGRISVNSDLTVGTYSNVFALGDMTIIEGVPGVAQPAIQEGKYVAQVLNQKIKSKPVKPFRYKNLGSMATIGKTHAVAEVSHFKFSGPLAFLLWGIVHVAYLVGWGNRFGAMLRWSWTVIARNRRERTVSTAAIEEAEKAQQKITAEQNKEAQMSIGHDQKKNL